MKALKFISLINSAEIFVDDYAKKLTPSEKPKKYFGEHEKSFIAEAMPKALERVLVLPNNPLFASQFVGAGAGASAAAASAAASAAPVSNYSVSKVWIDPGCIVCDACETIFPEVFEVKADTCIIKPGAPLNDGLRIQEAAEACPVEVIKFTKVA
jgi:ferredoxin